MSSSSPGPGGRLVQVKRGHYGIAYQGLNMEYLGQSAASWKEYFPDGTEWNGRTISKILNEEQGRHGAVARLVERGAPPLPDDLDPHLWFTRAKRACGITRRRHPGKHKYALRIGRTRAERTRTVIGLSVRPYPKLRPQLLLPGMDSVPADPTSPVH